MGRKEDLATEREARLDRIVRLLQETGGALTGAELALACGVSRQVIVGDVALLRARGVPVIATPQGYLWWRHGPSPAASRVFACRHGMSAINDELLAIVRKGGRIRDVIVEHPVYGDLRGTLELADEEAVRRFTRRLGRTGARPLSDLTGGIHLHTVEAPTPDRLDAIEAELRRLGLLYESGAGDSQPLPPGGEPAH